jgi:hypothetical protein
MRSSLPLVATLVALLLSAHRVPAPIFEDSSTPGTKQSPKQKSKPKVTSEKSEGFESPNSPNEQPESSKDVEKFTERDVVSFPSASESGLVELKNVPAGVYKIKKLRRMTYHISKEIGFRACFTHTLVVAGTFDNLDKTYKSVAWGTIDLKRGWITSFAANVPMTIVSAGGAVSDPVEKYYWQQITRTREQKDTWKWAADQPNAFRAWYQIAKIFDPKNEEAESKLYKMTGSREKDGFDFGKGRIKVTDGTLTLFAELERDNYVDVVALEYLFTSTTASP